MEVQESGAKSPGSRVPWRGNSHLNDGAEWGKDLSGGWNDAGDTWKSNTTMSYMGAVAAWAYTNFPQAYARAGAKEQLANNLAHGNNYLLKTIVDPNPVSLSNFSGYEIYVDVAGTGTTTTGGSQAQPDVHGSWSAAEVTDVFMARRASKVNTTVRGPDVAALMAASLAGAAMVQQDNGSTALAQSYLQAARKLFEYARLFPFDANSYDASGAPLALQQDGSKIALGYRALTPVSHQLLAAGLLYRAENTAGLGNAANATTYLQFATTVVSNPTQYNSGFASGSPTQFAADWDMFGWWRDTMAGQINHLALLQWIALQPSNATFTAKAPLIEGMLTPWCNAGQPGQHLRTPGGLAYRPVYSGTFSLQWNLNNMMVAAAYGIKQNRPAYYACAKSQLDYALGANPSGTSYIVGYGTRWLSALHHRGATGGWAGFDSITPGKEGYLAANRHIAYGAMPGGPNPYAVPGDADAPPTGRTHTETEPGVLFNAGLLGTLAAVVATESNYGSPDTYLPPPEVRNTNTDPATTDREFFGEARLSTTTATYQKIDVRVNNRTRWPSRITTQTKLRVFLELLPGTSVSDLSASVQNGPAHLLLGTPTLWKTGVAYVDLDFSGERLSPNYIWQANNTMPGMPNDMHRRSATLQINFASGKGISLSRQSLAGVGPSSYTIQPTMAVYEANALVGGIAP